MIASQGASAQSVAAAVPATPDTDVFQAPVSGAAVTAPSPVMPTESKECDRSQSTGLGQTDHPDHCGTDPADEDQDGEKGHSCRGVFRGPPSGSLVKTTSAGANGSTVAPGQTINVTITWRPSDFGGYRPVRTLDCVMIGRHSSTTLSQEHKWVPAGGTDHFSYTVPLDGTGGDQICDRAAVSGPWENTEKTAILCYTVMGAMAPEVPQTLMLPVVALLVFASALWIARRRRHRLRH